MASVLVIFGFTTRKWFLTVTWIHIWPPSYCSFLVGEKKRRNGWSKGSIFTVFKSLEWLLPKLDPPGPSQAAADWRNPKGGKRWSRKEGIRRGGGKPTVRLCLAAPLKIPKRPLTALTEVAAQLSWPRPPTNSLNVVLVAYYVSKPERFRDTSANQHSGTAPSLRVMVECWTILRTRWDRTVEGFRKSNSSAGFCEVVTGWQEKVEVFKAKGTNLDQLRNMKFVGMFVWNFFFKKKNQSVATYTCPC